ncbi:MULTISPECIES: hypothetical protein [Pseudomonas]|jgi:hypothetical protein|uniref:hypothetical protein n=1 Tax=Pseudomonas TaxID=286 RepID=UPI00177E57F7|nr:MULTISPECIES: hypothetical protein [Pseudomonas]MBD9607120.1 hypothetical protein [Pseudomonas sp. PDM08]
MRSFCVAVAFVAPIVLSTTVAAEVLAHKTALAFVAQTHVGDSLPTLALLAAKKTQTFAMLIEKLGSEKAHSAVSSEIDALLPQYQPKWNQNLAAAYEKSFTEEELLSLTSEGQASKYAGKVLERRTDIGRDMQSSSTPILIALVSEALKAAYSKHIR